MFRPDSDYVCRTCGHVIHGDEPRCSVCGALNETAGWVQPNRKGQCGNCHAGLEPEDKYCRICGTKAGEGAFAPYQNLMQCIYGPMPVQRTHTCPQCGFSWITHLMIDRQRFCPKCGCEVTTEEPHSGAMGMFN